MSAQSLLSANQLNLTRQGRSILSNISLQISAGEIVSLIGPNGAGKTTLLRVLLGLQRADNGHVNSRNGLRIGYVPQRLTLDPLLPLTARRFLQLWTTSPPALEQVVTQVNASALLERPLASMSGGELQRLLLARALLNQPELLVLDEPAQALDLQGQKTLYQLLADWKANTGGSVLMVSHDLTVVMRQTDRVLCLNGHICCAGKPSAVAEDPVYAALFGPAAPAFALYHHHHDHQHECGGNHAH